jgi:phenylacetate-CoA ligase
MERDFETLSRSRADLTQWQTQQLRTLLQKMLPTNRFWQPRCHAAGLSAENLRSLDDLGRLPTIRKTDLAADQAEHPPYGTILTETAGNYSRLHQTSGTTTGQPMRWLDTAGSWLWVLECWRQNYRLLGLRPDDRLCFPFSFGPFLGFWAGFEGAAQLGNLCIAAGGMSSEARLRLIAENQVTIVGCTPTYALRLAEVARQQGMDLPGSSVRAILVAGEPGGSLPETRRRIEAAWGARVFDHWGMTELGPLATEAEDDPAVLTVLETECIAEVLQIDNDQPAPPGQFGELVITNLGRTGSPLLRYRTGDLVQPVVEPHPSGRCLLRLAGGVVGRADDMLIIRGNNVFPASIEQLVRTLPEIEEFRIVVTSHRAMTHVRLEIEPLPDIPAERHLGLAEQLVHLTKDRLNFHPEVRVVAPGTLPRFEMKARRLVRE